MVWYEQQWRNGKQKMLRVITLKISNRIHIYKYAYIYLYIYHIRIGNIYLPNNSNVKTKYPPPFSSDTYFLILNWCNIKIYYISVFFHSVVLHSLFKISQGRVCFAFRFAHFGRADKTKVWCGHKNCKIAKILISFKNHKL